MTLKVSRCLHSRKLRVLLAAPTIHFQEETEKQSIHDCPHDGAHVVTREVAISSFRNSKYRHLLLRLVATSKSPPHQGS